MSPSQVQWYSQSLENKNNKQTNKQTRNNKQTNKGRLQNPTAGWPVVPSGSGRLSLFSTIETGQNRTEPPVNRRLGFEAVPKQKYKQTNKQTETVEYTHLTQNITEIKFA